MSFDDLPNFSSTRWGGEGDGGFVYVVWCCRYGVSGVLAVSQSGGLLRGSSLCPNFTLTREFPQDVNVGEGVDNLGPVPTPSFPSSFPAIRSGKEGFRTLFTLVRTLFRVPETLTGRSTARA